MSVATSTSHIVSASVAASVAIACAFPCTSAEHVEVRYGLSELLATLNTDYTVALASDKASFTVTPTASLITKINNLISATVGEVNRLIIRRREPFVSAFVISDAQYRQRVANEFDAVNRKSAELKRDISEVSTDITALSTIVAGLVDTDGASSLLNIPPKNTSTGTGNTYALTTSVNFDVYAHGMLIGMVADKTNTDTSVLNCNDVGAKKVYCEGRELDGGEIANGGAYLFAYDVALNGGLGGWHLLNGERKQELLIDAFGAVGDGSTNDTPAFHAAAAALGGAGTILLSRGKSYLIDGDMTLPPGVTVAGPYRGGPPVPGWNTFIDWSRLNSRLVVNPAASIILEGGAGIESAVIVRKGMTLPALDADDFAGTAIKFSSRQDNQDVRDCLIVGFNLAIMTNSDRLGVTPQTSRFTIERVWADCNSGLDIDTTYDSARVRDVHLWPFATIETYADGGSTDHTLLTRPGSGVKVRNAADDLQLTGVIAYGFAVGLDLDDTGSLNFGHVWIDYPSAIRTGSGSIGIKTGANTTRNYIAAAFVWGVEYAVQHLANNGETLVFGHLCMNTVDIGLTVTGGDVVAPNVAIANITSYAVNVTSAASRVYMRGTAANVGASEYVAAPAGGTFEKLDIKLIVDDTAKTLFGVTLLPLPTIASADPLVVPIGCDKYKVSGTTNIGTIGGHHGGREITLVFMGVLTVFHGTGTQNAKLAGGVNLVTAAGTVLRLLHDGTSWQEISRKTP